LNPGKLEGSDILLSPSIGLSVRRLGGFLYNSESRESRDCVVDTLESRCAPSPVLLPAFAITTTPIPSTMMTKLSSLLSFLALTPLIVSAHTTADHTPTDEETSATATDAWYSKYGQTGDLSFTGVTSFAHLPHIRCLDNPSAELDVAIIGMPFDSAVSFRPGARFGPFGIRSGESRAGITAIRLSVRHTNTPPPPCGPTGSRRQTKIRGYSSTTGLNPYQSGYSVIDCGDVPISPFDPSIAIPQVQAAYASLLSRKVANASAFQGLGFAEGLDGRLHPRIISLGGDHTIVGRHPTPYHHLPSLTNLY